MCYLLRLNGCYEALIGGTATEALVDFTGGLGGRFELRDKVPADLFNIMLRAHSKGGLMSVSIEVGTNLTSLCINIHSKN